jgi:hypothetical protein
VRLRHLWDSRVFTQTRIQGPTELKDAFYLPYQLGNYGLPISSLNNEFVIANSPRAENSLHAEFLSRLKNLFGPVTK